MNKENQKKVKMNKYILDLRGGEVPEKKGKAAAVDFKCPKEVTLNMPWVNMGRGVINLEVGIQLPPNVGLDMRSRSGFTINGMRCDVVYFDEQDEKVGLITDVNVDADIQLGLVDEDYKQNIGALYKVNSCNFMPTPDSKIEINGKCSYFVFVVRAGIRICQGAFRKVENLEYELGKLDMSDDRGGGYGHTGIK